MANTRRAAHFENDAEWNAVWDDYEARRSGLRVMTGREVSREPAPEPAVAAAYGIVPGRSFPRRARGRARSPFTARPLLPKRRVRVARAVVAAVLAAAVLIGLWAALPWLLAARMTAALRSPDGAALARQIEPTAAMAGLREALLAEVPPGLDGAAGRWVANLAGRMAASAEARKAATDWIRLRAGVRDADALPRLEVLRDVRTLGPALFRLEYGPERGPGGMRFDVAWQGGDFRVVGLRTLDSPPRELPRLRPTGPVIARR